MGIQITGEFIPLTGGTYPILDAKHMKDGLKNVATLTERNAITDLRRKQGMIVGVQDDSSYWRLNAAPWAGDNTDWSEQLSTTKQGVFAYLNTETDTTIAAADTWQNIAGAFTNNPMSGFSIDLDNSGISYDGTYDHWFEIDWHASVVGDSVNIDLSIGISVDGSIQTPSIMSTLLQNTTDIQTISGTLVVELSTDEYINLVVKSDGIGDVLTFTQFTTTIKRFF